MDDLLLECAVRIGQAACMCTVSTSCLVMVRMPRLSEHSSRKTTCKQCCALSKSSTTIREEVCASAGTQRSRVNSPLA